MKTKFKLGLGLAMAMVFGACSADSIDAPISENWPDDFSLTEYSKANPDLAKYQIIAVIADSNEVYMQAVREKMTDSLLVATAEKKAPEPLTATDSNNVKLKANKYTISMSDSSEVAVFFDDEVSVKTLFTEYAGLSEEMWPGLSALINGMFIVDPVTGDTAIDAINGPRAMEYRSAFKNFHRFGFTATQDLAFIKTIEIDSSLIEKQFLYAGRYEGRPYRMCRNTDFKDPAVKTKKLDVTVVPDPAKDKWTYTFKDTVRIIEAEESTWKFLLSNGDTCVSNMACGKKMEEDPTLSITDTIKPPPTEKHDSVKVDSTLVPGKKTIIAPLSPNAVAPAANKDRVWDFSADLYCRDEADWEIYLIENP